MTFWQTNKTRYKKTRQPKLLRGGWANGSSRALIYDSQLSRQPLASVFACARASSCDLPAVLLPDGLPAGRGQKGLGAPAQQEAALLVDGRMTDMAVEVAIGTFRQAERPVRIDAEGFLLSGH